MSKIEILSASTPRDENVRRLLTQHKHVLLFFTAPWCPPCRQIKPLFREMIGKTKGLVVCIINADEPTFGEFKVERIPTFQLYLDNALVTEFTGANEDLLRAMLGDFMDFQPKRLPPSVLLPSNACKRVVKNDTYICDAVVVGAGPAGLTAALYLAQGGQEVVVFEGKNTDHRMPGGQLCTTRDVWNFPGFEQGIEGCELIRRMARQVMRMGNVCFVHDDVVDIQHEKGLAVRTEHNVTVQCRGIILATGSVPRHLVIPGYKQYWNRGVHTCAACDGFRYTGNPVVVVGGGDSAAEACVLLSSVASHVSMIVRAGSLRCNARNQKRLEEKKITVRYHTTLHSVDGDGQQVTHVTTNANLTISCSAVFVCIGHDPNDGLIRGKKHPLPPSIRLAGDLQDVVYRQAIVAAAEGCKAAMELLRDVL